MELFSGKKQNVWSSDYSPQVALKEVCFVVVVVVAAEVATAAVAVTAAAAAVVNIII